MDSFANVLCPYWPFLFVFIYLFHLSFNLQISHVTKSEILSLLCLFFFFFLLLDQYGDPLRLTLEVLYEFLQVRLLQLLKYSLCIDPLWLVKLFCCKSDTWVITFKRWEDSWRASTEKKKKSKSVMKPLNSMMTHSILLLIN